MERERSKIGSRILLVLILTAFALPTWGANTLHEPPFQKQVGKVAIVAQSGGDYTDPVTAMNNVASWCGSPSQANPCLLKVMPGVVVGGRHFSTSLANLGLPPASINLISSHQPSHTLLNPSKFITDELVHTLRA